MSILCLSSFFILVLYIVLMPYALSVCTQDPSLLGVYHHLLMDTPELKVGFKLLTKNK